MSGSKPPANHPCQLRVEGQDDLFVIAGLLARHGLTFPDAAWYPLIAPMDSVDQLLPTIPLEMKSTTPRVGFVLDADTSVADRWRQVRGRCAKVGVELEEQPHEGGTIIEIGNRRRGFWLMPDNVAPGALEDFLSSLVPTDDALWPIAQKCTAEALEAGAPIGEGQRSKGHIHTWLAWQERPGMPFGTALTAEVLGKDGRIATRFLEWVRQLFGAGDGVSP